jgi:hypothetical protein
MTASTLLGKEEQDGQEEQEQWQEEEWEEEETRVTRGRCIASSIHAIATKRMFACQKS